MPWTIEKRDNEFCVIKDSTGESEGCHATESGAEDQLTALNIAESESKESAENTDFETKEMQRKARRLLHEKANNMGVTSFTEMDEAKVLQEQSRAFGDLYWDFEFMAWNIMFGDTENKTAEFRTLADEFVDRLEAESNVKSSVTLNELVQDAKDTSGAMTKFIDAVRGIFSKKEADVDTKGSASGNFMVYKDSDEAGTFRWIAQYSNKYRDNDNPAEIISSESHRKFAALVKSGIVPPPKLWLWHNKDWEFGQADWVAYDETGFAIAGGHFYEDEDSQSIAKTLSELDDVGVSHGMPRWSITRDSNDKTVITEHITAEISPLPLWAAANQLTGFVVMDDKEKSDMAFTNEDKTKLTDEWGISSDLIARIEQANKTASKSAENSGIESKETTAEGEVDEEVKAAATDDTDDEEEVVEEKGNSLLVEKAIAGIYASIIGLSDQVKAVSAKVDAMQVSETEKVKETARLTPLASLEALMKTSVTSIGNPDARIDGRTTLAKSAPVETEVPILRRTGIPFIDGMMANGGGK